MTPEIQARESYWRGTVFRSRTEARWAAFFSELGLEWEYEPEGFRFGSGDSYLPDFWIGGMRVWVEAKPSHGPNTAERAKAEQLVLCTGQPLLFLAGLPAQRTYELLAREEHEGVARVVTWLVCWHGKYSGYRWRDEGGRWHRSEPRDDAPRMFYGPTAADLTDCPYVRKAIRIANLAPVMDPDAGSYLPIGCDASEVAVDGGDDEVVASFGDLASEDAA